MSHHPIEDQDHMGTSPEAGTCPLCGKPNHCAVPAGKDPYSCWCMTTRIPQALRDRVPASLRGKACICLSCVEAYNQETKTTTESGRALQG